MNLQKSILVCVKIFIPRLFISNWGNNNPALCIVPLSISIPLKILQQQYLYKKNSLSQAVCSWLYRIGEDTHPSILKLLLYSSLLFLVHMCAVCSYLRHPALCHHFLIKTKVENNSNILSTEQHNSLLCLLTEHTDCKFFVHPVFNIWYKRTITSFLFSHSTRLLEFLDQ